MARKKLKTKEPVGKEATFPSGCTVLDCALGGGWAESRVVNVVGDNSTGKTLLAIEAAANFILKYPEGRVIYNEAEAAFDQSYAESLGFPLEKVLLEDNDTVEGIFGRMEELFSDPVPTLYVVDSLDAVTDKAEQGRGIDEATYGMSKQRQISSLFRRNIRKLKSSRVTVFIISQVRDKIGATFGNTKTRSGGKALDFYASQIVWLAHIGKVIRTRKEVKRATGVNIKADIRKNKVGVPHREAEFQILFNFGTEDLVSNLRWLKANKKFGYLDMTQKDGEKLLSGVNKLGDDRYYEELAHSAEAVKQAWHDIEEDFRPPRRKYK